MVVPGAPGRFDDILQDVAAPGVSPHSRPALTTWSVLPREDVRGARKGWQVDVSWE